MSLSVRFRTESLRNYLMFQSNLGELNEPLVRGIWIKLVLKTHPGSTDLNIVLLGGRV